MLDVMDGAILVAPKIVNKADGSTKAMNLGGLRKMQLCMATISRYPPQALGKGITAGAKLDKIYMTLSRDFLREIGSGVCVIDELRREPWFQSGEYTRER